MPVPQNLLDKMASILGCNPATEEAIQARWYGLLRNTNVSIEDVRKASQFLQYLVEEGLKDQESRYFIRNVVLLHDTRFNKRVYQEGFSRLVGHKGHAEDRNDMALSLWFLTEQYGELNLGDLHRELPRFIPSEFSQRFNYHPTIGGLHQSTISASDFERTVTELADHRYAWMHAYYYYCLGDSVCFNVGSETITGKRMADKIADQMWKSAKACQSPILTQVARIKTTWSHLSTQLYQLGRAYDPTYRPWSDSPAPEVPEDRLFLRNCARRLRGVTLGSYADFARVEDNLLAVYGQLPSLSDMRRAGERNEKADPLFKEEFRRRHQFLRLMQTCFGSVSKALSGVEACQVLLRDKATWRDCHVDLDRCQEETIPELYSYPILDSGVYDRGKLVRFFDELSAVRPQDQPTGRSALSTQVPSTPCAAEPAVARKGFVSPMAGEHLFHSPGAAGSAGAESPFSPFKPLPEPVDGLLPLFSPGEGRSQFFRRDPRVDGPARSPSPGFNDQVGSSAPVPRVLFQPK